MGLFAAIEGTSVNLTDVLIARTKPDDDGRWGRGIAVQMGAALMLTRGVLVDNHDLGLFAAGAGTSVDVTDVLIAGTKPDSDGTGGRGVNVQEGATLTLTRSVLVDNHEAGLLVTAAIASISDTVIADTRLGQAGWLGDGFLAHDSAVTALEVIVRGNARAGFLYSGSGGEVRGCYATDNAIGLVTQGAHEATSLDIPDDNLFEGNAQNVMTDGDLEVPDEMMAVPVFSDFD